MTKRSGNFPGKTHPIIQNARHFARENTQLRAPKRRQSRSELKRPDKTYAITPEPEKSTITGAQREIAKTDSGSHSLTNTWENQTKKGRGTYSLSLFHSYNRTWHADIYQRYQIDSYNDSSSSAPFSSSSCKRSNID